MIFKQYRRKQIAELRPYEPGENLFEVSISPEDLKAGSPKPGDMIARNPKNHKDQWLVAAAYFAENFEALSSPAPEETLPDRGKMVKPKLGAPSGGYGGADAAEELEVVATDRHDRELVDANAAEAIIEKLRAENERLTRERDKALEAEDAAKDCFWTIYPEWVEKVSGHALTIEAARTRLVERAEAAEARLAEAVEVLEWLDHVPGFGLGVHGRIRTFLQSLGKEGEDV